MVDTNLIKMAVDSYKGNLDGNYSVSTTQEAIKNVLIEANNGSTKLNYKAIRDGKCPELFSVIETLVNAISEGGLKEDDVFSRFVEDRNTAVGDSNLFHVQKDCLFAVANIANGSQSVRRQRIESGSDIVVPTVVNAVRIYEEIDRVLAGRVDFNYLVNSVSKSFTRSDLDAAYAAWADMFKTLESPYKETGSYDEEKLMDLIEHVEAETGETAIILGTQKALRKVETAVVSDSAKEDMYSLGHYGRFNGTEMIRMRQRHVVGGSTFILPDNTLYIVAGDSRPIKRVTEGDVTMLMGDPSTKADMTQEFLMMKKTGIGVVMDRPFGTYEMS